MTMPRRTTGGVRLVLPAVAALALTSSVVTAWLVGDLTELPKELDLDYYVTPVELDPVVEIALGISSTVVTAVILLILGVAARRRRIDPRWWSVVISVLAIGVIAGLGWRMLTVGVIGFNFGVGYAFIIGVPTATALLLFVALRSLYLIRGRHLGR